MANIQSGWFIQHCGLPNALSLRDVGLVHNLRGISLAYFMAGKWVHTESILLLPSTLFRCIFPYIQNQRVCWWLYKVQFPPSCLSWRFNDFLKSPKRPKYIRIYLYGASPNVMDHTLPQLTSWCNDTYNTDHHLFSIRRCCYRAPWNAGSSRLSYTSKWFIMERLLNYNQISSILDEWYFQVNASLL